MASLELRIPPVALVLAFAAAMAAVASVVPAPLPIPSPAGGAVAAGLVVAGGLVAAAGVIAFRRNRTTVNPFTPEASSSLVATGIYRFSRNPMYLGFLLALLGWGAFLANWAAALLLPAFVVYMNRFQIGPEERALARRFGRHFTDYSAAVRRWV